MKISYLFIILAVTFLLNSCMEDLITDPINLSSESNDNDLKSKQLPIKIAIVSDIHYLDPSLMKNNAADGADFQSYLAADPKLIQFSDPIFRKVISDLQNEKPDILLIPGDLTKDGEKISHEAMAKILQNLSKKGIKVFVIPGNHDINNPESAKYDGSNASETPTISADEFQNIYDKFGYKNAKYRDENSLSYICQPYCNLWILGIDDCKYEENTDIAIVSGRIKAGTMKWIQSKMQEANEKHITVLAMMHHGIMEHYYGQEQLDPGYVTDDWVKNANLLMEAGIKVMFTGHYHANDISMISSNQKTLYDIETGSLVSAPSPFRRAVLTANSLNIKTEYVKSIDCPMPNRLSFRTYSKLFFENHLDAYFDYVLSMKYLMPEPYAANFAPLFRNAIMAHYAGDEKISPKEQVLDDEVAAVSAQLGIALQSLWTDLPPKDNEIHIEMKK
jgi:predicted MPP superfamily phosphohydrolase